MKKFILLFLFISLVIKSQSVDIINSRELIKTVEFLSSKELAGRLPGHSGYDKAAKFMADQFSKLKLLPGGDNGFIQKLKVEYNNIFFEDNFTIIKDGKEVKYVLGKDYVYRGFTGSGNITASTAFCGYGLSQPELGYDDYAGIDVKGKVVLVFKYNPKWDVDGKVFNSGNPREKAIVAAKHGAIGILFVSFPNDQEPQKPIGSVINGAGEQMIEFPELHIDLPVANVLFDGSGYSLKELQTTIDNSKSPFSVPLLHKVKINVKTEYVKAKEVVNVVGLLEGTDPILKNEWLIIGAHLDHVGQQAGKIYFPGANDNASGSAAILQIARAFNSNPVKPKRSIAFLLFASEEQGLHGAQFFAEHLPFDAKSVKAMFNMDCIGYGDSIQIGGGESAKELWDTAKEIDSGNNKLLVNRTWKGGGADAEPFYQKGIPTLYFVTTNSYKHLHMLSDKADTLNPQLFEAITQLAYLTLTEIANKP
ncbi:MAG: M20/M25/M40 family metallo-hydrolase [Ignavibacteria bacterium]|nr:M20/M25/M40 family metallo-hydrolase [Ignavibacteria bacterium]